MSGTALAPITVLVPILATDAWVYSDASARNERGSPVVVSIGRFEIDTPAAWFVGCLILWIVFFPLYLTARGLAG
jgi:hypothetical protein